MNAYEETDAAGTTAVGRNGWFLRVAAAIGDLGSSFYDEERQRDVWNEASAVGLQVVLLLGLAAAGAMVWIGGAAALPYAFTVFAILGAASGVSVLYAQKLGVGADSVRAGLRLRLVPYGVLLVAFLAGAVRHAPSNGFGAGLAAGVVAGSVGGVVWLGWSGLRARRREQRGEV